MPHLRLSRGYGQDWGLNRILLGTESTLKHCTIQPYVKGVMTTAVLSALVRANLDCHHMDEWKARHRESDCLAQGHTAGQPLFDQGTLA